MVDRKQLGRRARKKGKAWEKRLRDILRTVFGDDVFNGDQSWKGGADAEEGADVDGTPFWFEAKHGKTVSVLAALRQAQAKQAEKGDTRPPVVLAKQDKKPAGWKIGEPNSPVLAVMRADHFFDLLLDHHRLRVAAGEDNLPIPKDDWSFR